MLKGHGLFAYLSRVFFCSRIDPACLSLFGTRTSGSGYHRRELSSLVPFPQEKYLLLELLLRGKAVELGGVEALGFSA